MSTVDTGAARQSEEDAVPKESAGWVRSASAYGALIASTCLLYAGVFGSGWFEIDDALYVPENPLLSELSGAHLARILSEPYFGNYSPAHLLSYLLDRVLGGLDPFVFHLSNALWGGACAAGVFALAHRLIGSARAAWVASLLFVLHPAHVEAIAWISSRKDLVAAAFAIPATIAYLNYRSPAPGARAGTAYALSLGLFVVATAGKLSVVVLPAAFLVFDLFAERRAFVASLLDKLPYALIVLFFGLRAASAQPDTNVALGAGEIAQIGGWLVWLLMGLGDYVIFRPVPDPAAGPATVFAWASAFAVFVGGPWLFARRALRSPRSPAVSRTAGGGTLGLALSLHAWLVLALLPSQVLGFVYPVSDRYLFFPSVPFVLLIALGAERVLRIGSPALRKSLIVGLLALGGVWGAKTWTAVRSWADARSVFHAQANKVSDINAHEYLALHYLRAVDALLDAGSRGGPLPDGAADLARAFGFDADVLEREWSGAAPRRPATGAFTQALVGAAWTELERAKAIPTERSLPSLFYRRGRVLDLRGDPQAALVEFERSEREARIHPIVDVADAYKVQSLYSQALMLERLGDVCTALERMRKAAIEDSAFADVKAQVRRLQALCE